MLLLERIRAIGRHEFLVAVESGDHPEHDHAGWANLLLTSSEGR